MVVALESLMSRWHELWSHLRLRQADLGPLNPLRYLGPGLLVAVGFVDPGNWASNLAAGAGYGLSVAVGRDPVDGHADLAATQRCPFGDRHWRLPCRVRHAPSARLGFTTRSWFSHAGVAATAFAEILGGAIALGMLFHLPLKLGVCITALVVAVVLFLNTYKAIEKLIVGFVSLNRLGFLFELLLVKIHWTEALVGWVSPTTPPGAMSS